MVPNSNKKISEILKANFSLKNFDFCKISIEDALRIMQECEENGESRMIPSDIYDFFKSALTIAAICYKEEAFSNLDFVSVAIFLYNETEKALKNTAFSYENFASDESIAKNILRLKCGSEEDRASAFVMITVIETFLKQENEKDKINKESIHAGMTKLLLIFCWAYQKNIVTAKEVLIAGKFFDLAYKGELK